jgi:hypothetical protein
MVRRLLLFPGKIPRKLKELAMGNFYRIHFSFSAEDLKRLGLVTMADCDEFIKGGGLERLMEKIEKGEYPSDCIRRIQELPCGQKRN